MTEAELYRRFGGAWRQEAGEYFVARDSAISFVELLFQEQVRILGIDGFVLGKDFTQPLLDVISDFSSGAPSKDDVLRFLQTGMSKVSHFNFVLEAK